MLNKILIYVNIFVGDSMDKENNKKNLNKKLDELSDMTDEKVHEFLNNIPHKKRVNMNPYKIYDEITKEK